MKLHEFQAKDMLRKFGVPVPAGVLVQAAAGVDQVKSTLSGEDWVVKAQVYAGGRGKGGGIKKVHGVTSLRETVSTMLGSRLVTPQTESDGLPVDSVLVEEAGQIAQEYYLGLTLDRSRECISIIASASGGMDIEEVAASDPAKIIRIRINPITGLNSFQCRQVAYGLQLPPESVKPFSQVLNQLYRLCVAHDASLLEINPLVRQPDGNFVALDAKLLIDDNALYRQQELAAWHDPRQENAQEMRAKQHELNYVALHGNIGCMVNGAGLAMATMDLIKVHGGDPANFLDVGGTATAQRVAEAFKLILSDPKVKAILVNIFGGIVRCDLIAEGIIAAMTEVGITIPVVVRLEGTHSEQGRVLLKTKMHNVLTAENLTDAAVKAVAAARGA